MPRRGMGVEIDLIQFHTPENGVMPRRGMGVEIGEFFIENVLKASHAPQGHGSRNCPTDIPYHRVEVMPRRGMGVEIWHLRFLDTLDKVMPRRGMGVEIDLPPVSSRK